LIFDGSMAVAEDYVWTRGGFCYLKLSDKEALPGQQRER
jgi:hypothetical protein